MNCEGIEIVEHLAANARLRSNQAEPILRTRHVNASARIDHSSPST